MSKIVEVKNLHDSLLNLVAKREFFRIRLNSGGWSRNIYVPLYISKLSHLSEKNVVIFVNGDEEWKVGSIRTISNNDRIIVTEIAAKDSNSHKQATIPIEDIVCRLKKVYGKPKQDDPEVSQR
jgi:hypothetical protein